MAGLRPAASIAEGVNTASGEVAVLVADDSVLTRAAVRRALERHGFVVVAEAQNAAEALDAAIRHQPDVCLVGDELPGGGIATIEEISISVPSARIAVLTKSIAKRTAMRALRAGASGYVLKTIAPDRLTVVLQEMMRGELAVPRAVATSLAHELRAERSKRERSGWTLLYPFRFARHFYRRRRSGMPTRVAWTSARRRMQQYR